MEIKRESKDRFACASKDYLEGDLIFTDEPLECIVSSSSHCSRCTSQSVFRCTGCRQTFYCSRECQSKDWKYIHSIECKIYKHVFPHSPTPFARLALRLVLNNRMEEIRDQYCNHRDKLTQFEQENYAAVIMVVRKCLDAILPKDQQPSADVLMSMISMLTCNTVTITSPEMNEIGISLYPNYSKLNHSCIPNCIAVFEDAQVRIVAQQSIKRGQPLLINYVPTTDPKAERKSILEAVYKFTCKCEKCINVNDENCAFKCGYCDKSCIGVPEKFIAETDLTAVINIECPGCKCVSMKFNNTIQKYIDLTNKLNKLIKDLNRNEKTEDDLIVKSAVEYRKLLDRLDKMLGMTNNKLYKYRKEYIDVLCRYGLYKESIEISNKVLEYAYAVYPSALNVIRIHMELNHCRLLIWDDQVEEAKEMYKNVLKRLSLIYSNNSKYLQSIIAEYGQICNNNNNKS